MSFLTHTSENVLWMSSSLLDGSGVRHGFSTRTGGVSPAPWDSLNLGVGRGDDMDRVRENYRRFCAVLGTDEHRAVLSKQVHEDNVRHVTAEDCGKGLFRERDYTSVDAMITDTPDIPLVVFSADCGIILLYDPVRRAVGAAFASGLAEPAGAVLAYALVGGRLRPGFLNGLLVLVAGVMVWVSLAQLVPTALTFGGRRASAAGFGAGVAVMAIGIALLS